jgi:lysophospholipid acyltransferase (LPLAT)-like uncharacterized protein
VKTVIQNLVLLLAKLWLRSLRIEWQGEALHPKTILILWHEHLPICMQAFAHKNISVLISKSSDGDWASLLCKHLGYHVHRGSNSRGSLGGLKNLIRDAKITEIAGMALDGPRGPYHVIQPGALWLAQQLDFLVQPIAVEAIYAKRLSSWDKSLIPLPFSKVRMRLGQAFTPNSLLEIQIAMEENQELLEGSGSPVKG